MLVAAVTSTESPIAAGERERVQLGLTTGGQRRRWQVRCGGIQKVATLTVKGSLVGRVGLEPTVGYLRRIMSPLPATNTASGPVAKREILP